MFSCVLCCSFIFPTHCSVCFALCAFSCLQLRRSTFAPNSTIGSRPSTSRLPTRRTLKRWSLFCAFRSATLDLGNNIASRARMPSCIPVPFSPHVLARSTQRPMCVKHVRTTRMPPDSLRSMSVHSTLHMAWCRSRESVGMMRSKTKSSFVGFQFIFTLSIVDSDPIFSVVTWGLARSPSPPLELVREFRHFSWLHGSALVRFHRFSRGLGLRGEFPGFYQSLTRKFPKIHVYNH